MKYLLIAIVFVSLFSCSSTRYLKNTNSFSKELKNTPEFQNSFTGFTVYDPQTNKYLIEHNADRYFTPASNTKLFAYFTGLSVLGDSLPGLRYKTVGKDSIIIWGTGDPTFLHHFIKTSKVYDFLRSQKRKIYLSQSNDQTSFFCPGWAWEDYSDYFSAENSAFPIYGNVNLVSIDKVGAFELYPPYSSKFLKENKSISTKNYTFKRNFHTNEIAYHAKNIHKNDSIEIPFLLSDSLLLGLLEDSLKLNIQFTDYDDLSSSKGIYSYPADSLYKKMLQPSDNFLAQQIMVMASNELFDTLNTKRTISYVQDSLLTFLTDQPRWVDGSGLSRYNLFTPRSYVELLTHLFKNVKRKRLFDVMAVGGKYGTMKKRFTEFNPPIFYGKTGTLSNNHNLSGYLITKNNKILIFSFMMNHYRNSASKMRKIMDKIIVDLHERY
ncbi:MAG: D-alanyl-D-alanine carboxypeptidase [Bacteroidota bacterium]